MERFGDLRARHDLRRAQRERARHFAQSNLLQWRAETTTAAVRSVSLLIGPPRRRGVAAARAGQHPAGEGLGEADGLTGQALAVVAAVDADDGQEQTAGERPGQDGGGTEDEVQQHRYSALPLSSRALSGIATARYSTGPKLRTAL